MSGMLLWPAGTVRADLPSHPVAVGQREGPTPDDVAARMTPTAGCTSSPTKKHTLVNAHPADADITRTTFAGTRGRVTEDQPIIITTKVCQTCSRWVHFYSLQEAS